MKRLIGAVVAVFVALQVLDFLIHVVLLKNQYAASARLWRPEAEMKMVLMTLVSLLFVVCFVLIYDMYFKYKCVRSGVIYGLILGIGIGANMGYGTYAVMPIPYKVALGWFLGVVVELMVAGLITGLIMREANT